MPEFEAVVEEAMGGGGAWVTVPDDVLVALGGGGRIPVTATFDGHVYRGSVARYGGRSVLGILKEIRAAIGKQPGDTVVVTIERDKGPRTVALPDDLQAALREAQLEAAWKALAYTKRRQLVQAIDEAKKPETRARRITAAVDAARG